MDLSVRVIHGDILGLEVDAVVNAANTRLKGGHGLAGAIARRGGPSIGAECKKIGRCEIGTAVATNAGRLKAKYVIHVPTVGWIFRKASIEEIARGHGRP